MVIEQYIFAQSPFSPRLPCMTKAGGSTNSEGTASSLDDDWLNVLFVAGTREQARCCSCKNKVIS